MKGKMMESACMGQAAYIYRPAGESRCCCVLEGAGRETLEGVALELEKSGGEVPYLVALAVSAWDSDLTPWASDCIPGRHFSGGGSERVSLLRAELPEFLLQNALPCERNVLGIAGYSLGGLGAMYAYFETDLFSRAASVSGAMWYPGFVEYCCKREVKTGDRMYFSIGKQETRRGNPVMIRGGDAAEEICVHSAKFAESVFEWNNGNHFYEPEKRIARAIKWLYREENHA